MPATLAQLDGGELVAGLALVVLLVVAFRQLPGRVEAVAALVTVGACLAAGGTSAARSMEVVRRLFPVVAFLMAILIVSAACAELGLFRSIGLRIGRLGVSGPRFLGLTFTAAVAVTAVLSLDATVVLLTPAVLEAARRAGLRPDAAVSACVRLANSSSLLLPVSNLTTLLVLHELGLSFTRFALVMAPSWAVVIGVEYVGHRIWFRRELEAPPGPPATTPATTPAPAMTPATTTSAVTPRFPVLVLVAMLAGFLAGSAVGLAPAWSAAGAAVLLTGRLLSGSRESWTATLRRSADAANVGFACFVLGLGVVVEALVHGGLGTAVHGVLPHSSGLPQLLLLAFLATALANLLNNLPATLLLVPLVAPLGTVAVLATLVGLNVGASLTWVGSLANLLWRRTLVRLGAAPSGRDFHARALFIVPSGVALGVLVLWAWARLVL